MAPSKETHLHPSLTHVQPVSLDLEHGPGAVRAARHFVRSALREGVADLADDAELVVAELVTNAVLHATPPVSISVRASGSGVRIEVADGSTRPPVRPTMNPEAMTGRGLALVAALTMQWGFELNDGKVVWAELGDGHAGVDEDLDVDALIDAWADTDNDGGPQTYSVSLGDVPTDFLLEAKAHVDNLIREFALATSGAATGATLPVPQHLSELIDVVVNRFADARQAIKRQALAAASRGDERTFLTMTLPATAVSAGRDYLRALDEVESYARAARLLTLESPPQHRAFRRWYVNALVDQLTSLSSGVEPPQPPTFEEHLLSELGSVAEAQRATERAARLQRVTAALAGATTPEEVAAVVVSEGVAALESSGGGLLIPADESHIAVPGAVGYAEEIVEQMRAEGRDADLPAAQVLRTGIPVWLETRQERDEQFPSLAGFEPKTVAMCAVPMLVGHNTIGALRFSFDRPRLFDEDERRFVLALAAQAALALERALLFASERTAVERSAFLAEATQRLASSLEPDQTIQTLTSLLVPEFADWTVVFLRDEVGNAVPMAFSHRDPILTAKYRQTFLSRTPGRDEAAGVAEVLATGRSTRHVEIPAQFRDDTLRGDAQHDALLAAVAPTTSMCVPLTVRAEVIGAVGLARTSGTSYDDNDQRIVEDLATRAAVAVSNARSYQRERNTALTLQRSLLPQRLPTVPGVSFSWRYLPAGASTSIGGDWYDVLPLDEQRVAVVIGDVMGRGVAAAAIMGQLRATARAFASTQMTPADVLTQMDSAVARLEQGQITTAAVAILDVAAHTLTIASAGHLPPLLLHPDDGACYLDVEPGPPLGAATPEYPETTVTLDTGAMLLLFTDGLVEDRHRPVDVGMEELRLAIVDARDPEDLCTRALAVAGHDEQHEDDTALLAFALLR